MIRNEGYKDTYRPANLAVIHAMEDIQCQKIVPPLEDDSISIISASNSLLTLAIYTPNRMRWFANAYGGEIY